MADEVIPDFNRANSGSLQGVIDSAIARYDRQLENMLPAEVISYDRSTGIAVVKPSIKMVATDGKLLNRASVSVKVYNPGGGGFVISMPLIAGSKGWIKACDRDISLYMQGGDTSAPNTKRTHSFSDGVFYPDNHGGVTVPSDDNDAVVIQNTAGTIKISLRPDRVRITSPLMEIDSAAIKFTTNPVIGPL